MRCGCISPSPDYICHGQTRIIDGRGLVFGDCGKLAMEGAACIVPCKSRCMPPIVNEIAVSVPQTLGCHELVRLRNKSSCYLNESGVFQGNLASIPASKSMASGLEVVGALAASLELVKVAKSCLVLFNDLRHVEIRDMERRGLQFHFYVQGVRFERWCSCLGIQDMFDLSTSDNAAWIQSRRVESFEVLLQSQLHFKNSKYADLTLSVLGDICKKLSEADIIMSRYSGASTPATPTTTKGNGSRLSTRWSKLTGKSKEGTKPSLSVVDSADDLSVSRLRIGMSSVQWLTHGKSMAQELLESIGRINDSLVELLGPSLQAQVSRRSNMAILEHLHFDSQNIRNLPEGSDLRALANMKEWQAQDTKEGCNEANSLKSNITSGDDLKLQKPPTFSVQDFEQNSLRTGDSRSFSTLSGTPVVIEWRYYSNKRPLKLEYSFRLMHLVGLLNQSNLYKKFTALPCKGLVDDRDNYRIGIVFAMETSSTTTAKSLQDVIHRSSRTPPPIGERFLIAKRFAIGIHNLHAAQWLHKGIRSDNVRHK